jgi:hypothetical protein
VGDRRVGRVAELHGHRAKNRRGEDRGQGEEHRPQHTAPSSNARLTTPPPRNDREGCDGEDEDRREESMRPFDDQVRPIHRWKEMAVAERPVIAASHPRAGDADDGAEDEVRERDE